VNDRGTTVWWWFPVAVTAGLTWTMYVLAADAERGTRAGAEPGMTGILIAFPFFTLLLVEALCALCATASETRAGQTRSLWCATVAAALVAGLVLAALVVSWRQGYWSMGRTTRFGCLVVALLLPLAPTWLSYVRDRPSHVQPLPSEPWVD
jgi:hypothetical protein